MNHNFTNKEDHTFIEQLTRLQMALQIRTNNQDKGADRSFVPICYGDNTVNIKRWQFDTCLSYLRLYLTAKLFCKNSEHLCQQLLYVCHVSYCTNRSQQVDPNVNSQHTNEQHASKDSQLANNTSRTPKSAANGVDRSAVYFKMTTHTFDFNKKNCDTRSEDGMFDLAKRTAVVNKRLDCQQSLKAAWGRGRMEPALESYRQQPRQFRISYQI